MEEGLISPLGALREVPHEAVFDHGRVCSKLLEAANKCGSELIVIGTHGRQGIEKLFKGSTAEEIAYAAGVPVLMVGPKVTRRADFKRILYACDISDRAFGALPYALSLREVYSTTLALNVSCWRMEGSMSDAAMQFVESFRQQLEQCSSASEDGIFESLRERLHPYCYPQLLNGLGFFAQELSNTRSVTSDSADVTVNFGSPAHSILKIMESQQIDLVVMSSQCKQGISARIAAHLSESLTYAVAAQAACPVLAVPPAKRQIGLCSMGL